MDNEILVHIGIPKTGTSSLQSFLALNNNVLQANGWCYPDARGNFENKEVSDDGRWANGGLYPFVLSQKLQDTVWKHDLDYFFENIDRNIKKYKIILSEESLWFDIEGIEFIQFLKERYKRLRLIVYLRRQDEEIESVYAQLIKNLENLNGINRKECIMPLQEFWMSILTANDKYSHMYHYFDKLQELESIVGIKNLAVYTYEEAREYGLFKHFVHFLGLKYEQFRESDHVNITPPPMETEVKRRLNSAFVHQPDTIIRQLDRVYMTKTVKGRWY